MYSREANANFFPSRAEYQRDGLRAREQSRPQSPRTDSGNEIVRVDAFEAGTYLTDLRMRKYTPRLHTEPSLHIHNKRPEKDKTDDII